jgi:hypothetical protein
MTVKLLNKHVLLAAIISIGIIGFLFLFHDIIYKFSPITEELVSNKFFFGSLLVLTTFFPSSLLLLFCSEKVTAAWLRFAGFTLPAYAYSLYLASGVRATGGMTGTSITGGTDSEEMVFTYVIFHIIFSLLVIIYHAKYYYKLKKAKETQSRKPVPFLNLFERIIVGLILLYFFWIFLQAPDFFVQVILPWFASYYIGKLIYMVIKGE